MYVLSFGTSSMNWNATLLCCIQLAWIWYQATNGNVQIPMHWKIINRHFKIIYKKKRCMKQLIVVMTMTSLYLNSARLVEAENLDCHSSETASVQIFSLDKSRWDYPVLCLWESRWDYPVLCLWESHWDYPVLWLWESRWDYPVLCLWESRWD